MKISLITTLPSLIENRRLKQEAEALGHEFNIIDLKDFGFSVEKGKLNINGLSEMERSDVVIVRGIFNSIKSISAVVTHLRKKGVRVFDNNFLGHLYSINKIADLVKLSLKNIPVPDTRYAREFEEYPENCAQIGYPVIIKSTRMGKGVGVYKVDSEFELKKLIGELESKDKDAKSYIIQEFIPYEYDLRCLIIGKHVYTMRRIPGEGEFRANFSLGGDVELFDLDSKGEELAKKALSAIDMSIGGVDILITKDDKRCILEVNHTAGFTGMEQATGDNIGKLWIKHAIDSAK